MSLINKDHAHTTWPKEPVWIDNEPKGESIIIRLAVAIVLTLAIATIYAVCSSPAFGTPSNSVVGATYDNLMSPERAEFMVLFEYGQEFDEGDME
jgi:hypothetical protein